MSNRVKKVIQVPSDQQAKMDRQAKQGLKATKARRERRVRMGKLA
jgi:hypothetical protein